jgi:hypothetical protein
MFFLAWVLTFIKLKKCIIAHFKIIIRYKNSADIVLVYKSHASERYSNPFLRPYDEFDKKVYSVV